MNLQGKSILSIDDSLPDQELISLAFEKCGWDVPLRAMSAEEGWVKLRENESKIKLIILDLNLPRESGLEFLAKIRKSKYKLIPVIILSTSSDENDINASYDNFANAYIVKPAGFQDFVLSIGRMLSFYLQTVSLP